MSLTPLLSVVVAAVAVVAVVALAGIAAVEVVSVVFELSGNDVSCAITVSDVAAAVVVRDVAILLLVDGGDTPALFGDLADCPVIFAGNVVVVVLAFTFVSWMIFVVTGILIGLSNLAFCPLCSKTGVFKCFTKSTESVEFNFGLSQAVIVDITGSFGDFISTGVLFCVAFPNFLSSEVSGTRSDEPTDCSSSKRMIIESSDDMAASFTLPAIIFERSLLRDLMVDKRTTARLRFIVERDLCDCASLLLPLISTGVEEAVSLISLSSRFFIEELGKFALYTKTIYLISQLISLSLVGCLSTDLFKSAVSTLASVLLVQLGDRFNRIRSTVMSDMFSSLKFKSYDSKTTRLQLNDDNDHDDDADA
uniref:Uncharacterized protein n=1 Tax=Glossina brevipalpis TaxID=37001 RepID=A0A1A9WVS5_9MUSC